MTIYSKRLANELDTFIWKNGRPQAQRGYNDDLVMAAAIGCWVRDTAIVENQKDVEYKKAFLNSITTTRTNLDTRSPGQYKASLRERFEEEQKIRKEFSWIFKG